MKINLRTVLTGVVLVLFLAGAVFFVRRNRSASIPPGGSGASLSGLPTFSKTRGPANAPVKLVEYSDFECPSCRNVQSDIHNLFNNYPGKIQLTYKHYPLSSHKWSSYAHQAAECMNAQKKFWPFHDKLYANQSGWTLSKTPPLEIFFQYALDLGANIDQFGKCMSDGDITQRIYAEKEEGNKLQVSATPTFFLGKERFVGPKEMQERGENAVRKVLGLPPKPVKKTQESETLLPAPLKGAANELSKS